MISGLLRGFSHPDIPAMKEKKNLHGLTQALQHRDLNIQWKAAQALGELGTDGVEYLIHTLDSTRNKEARLGIIEALGIIGDARAVNPLISHMKDGSNEIRWETALALGEIGDSSAIPSLKSALNDPDKYVRYGAALALRKLSWVPENESEKASLLVGMQEWENLEGLGPDVIGPVANAMRDPDKSIRLQAVRTMGSLRMKEAIPMLYKAISDPDEDVRWQAVQSAPSCGLPMSYLPRALARRPRSRKNPLIAGFLNFVLPGTGYMYLGFWWGIILFQVDVQTTLLIYQITDEYQSLESIFSIYLTLFSIWLIFSVHAWFVAKNMPDL